MKYLFRSLFYLFIAVRFSSAFAGSYEDFFRAVDTDNSRMLGSVLARGFDPNSPDERGQVGLYLALRGDSDAVADVLLAHPATQVDKVNAAGETPLMIAALRGRLDWVQRLLARGGRADRDGWTPLHYAASGPEPKIMALLLERGARVDALSPNRSTPLMMAARYGGEDAAGLLLARGADARLRNDKGLNAADFARLAGRDALAERLDRLTR